MRTRDKLRIAARWYWKKLSAIGLFVLETFRLPFEWLWWIVKAVFFSVVVALICICGLMVYGLQVLLGVAEEVTEDN